MFSITVCHLLQSILNRLYRFSIKKGNQHDSPSKAIIKQLPLILYGVLITFLSVISSLSVSAPDCLLSSMRIHPYFTKKRWCLSIQILYHPNRDDEVMRLLLFHQAHDPGFLSFSYCYGRSPVIRLFLLPAPGF